MKHPKEMEPIICKCGKVCNDDKETLEELQKGQEHFFNDKELDKFLDDIRLGKAVSDKIKVNFT